MFRFFVRTKLTTKLHDTFCEGDVRKEIENKSSNDESDRIVSLKDDAINDYKSRSSYLHVSLEKNNNYMSVGWYAFLVSSLCMCVCLICMV